MCLNLRFGSSSRVKSKNLVLIELNAWCEALEVLKKICLKGRPLPERRVLENQTEIEAST